MMAYLKLVEMHAVLEQDNLFLTDGRTKIKSRTDAIPDGYGESKKKD
jgi:hypothetical protein